MGSDLLIGTFPVAFVGRPHVLADCYCTGTNWAACAYCKESSGSYYVNLVRALSRSGIEVVVTLFAIGRWN